MELNQEPNININEYIIFLNNPGDNKTLTDALEEFNYKSKTLSENVHFIIEFEKQKQLNDEKSKKEKRLIRKKRSSTDNITLKKENIPKFSYEIKMENILNDIIKEIPINYIEFLNKIYKSDYNYQLNFTIKKNMISNYIYNKDILDKNLKEIILLSQENELEKESIKNKIEAILIKEKKNNNLKFYNMLNMKLKDLLLIYVNNRVNKFNDIKLKTLKDNTNYSEKEKEQIKKVFLNYINYPKETTSNNSDNKFDIPQPPENSIPLSNNDVLENGDIINAVSIEKNKSQNIAKREVNQEKDEEQKFSEMKTKDKTDENRGFKLEILVEMTIEKIFYFVFNKIEELLTSINRKFKKVNIYSKIQNNSTEEYKAFFDKTITDILKEEKENEELIQKILDDKNNSDKLENVKELLNMRFLDIFNKYIKEVTFNFKNGTEIKIDIESENNRNVENVLQNGNSCRNEKPKVFKTQIVERINEDTKEGKTNDTKKIIIFSVKTETILLGKNDNEINNKNKSNNIENLSRISVKECYISLCKMIETIGNVKLDYSCYKYISGDSAEKYLKFFNNNIGENVGKNNNEITKSILNSDETSEEKICLKILFRIKFFNVIYNYINDLPFTFTKSNGFTIELKLFKNEENENIRKYSKEIKDKINEILKAKGRLRAKKNK